MSLLECDQLAIEEILKEHFCADDELRPEMTKIHKTDGYIVASDGKILVEIDTNIIDGLSGIGEEVSDYPNWKGVMPSPKVSQATTISTDELMVVVNDREPKVVICTECDGEGGMPHDCECEYCMEDWEYCEKCDGEGKHREGDLFYTLVKIGESYYKGLFLKRVKKILDVLGIDEVTIFKQNAADHPVLLTATGVQFLIASYNVVEGESDFYEIVKEISFQ